MRGYKLLCLIATVAASLAHSVAAADFPAMVIPQPLGVSVHMGNIKPADLDMIAQAGLKIVRTDLTWKNTEKTAGVYDWGAYDQFARELRQRGLRPLFILTYSNPLYEPMVEVKQRLSPGGKVQLPAAPRTQASMEAYARWAAAAVAHFDAYSPMWEIWNEPEADKFWPPKADAKVFAALANTACRAMRTAVPDATIMAPGAAHVPSAKDKNPAFMATLLESGIMDCIDAVSVHPYLPSGELDDTPRMWNLLREAMQSARGQSDTRPLPAMVNSEWGYSSVAAHKTTPRQQAGYYVRMQLQNVAAGIPVSIWYGWKNDGFDGAEREFNFGLADPWGNPKPAYHAAQVLNGQLHGYVFDCRMARPNPYEQVLAFKHPASALRKLVVWHGNPKAKPKDIPLPKWSTFAGAATMFGEPLDLKVEHGVIRSVPFGPEPLYIALRMAGKTDMTACTNPEKP